MNHHDQETLVFPAVHLGGSDRVGKGTFLTGSTLLSTFVVLRSAYV